MNSTRFQDTRLSYRNLLHFYTLRESKITSCLKSHEKRIKYLEINLTKEVKDLYSENYKTLMKEIEDDAMEINPMLLDWKN